MYFSARANSQIYLFLELVIDSVHRALSCFLKNGCKASLFCYTISPGRARQCPNHRDGSTGPSSCDSRLTKARKGVVSHPVFHPFHPSSASSNSLQSRSPWFNLRSASLHCSLNFEYRILPNPNFPNNSHPTQTCCSLSSLLLRAFLLSLAASYPKTTSPTSLRDKPLEKISLSSKTMTG